MLDFCLFIHSLVTKFDRPKEIEALRLGLDPRDLTHEQLLPHLLQVILVTLLFGPVFYQFFVCLTLKDHLDLLRLEDLKHQERRAIARFHILL